MANIELKPCPFCGGKVQLIDTGLSRNYQFFIRHPAWQKNGCIFDDGKVFYADSAELAAEAWNRRSDDNCKDDDTAEWIDKEMRGTMTNVCSVCGSCSVYPDKYCGGCGRSMKNGY